MYFCKKAVFLELYFCKKAGFLHKKAAFLQKYIFVKKAVFLHPINLEKNHFFYVKMTLFYKDRFLMQHIYICIGSFLSGAGFSIVTDNGS